MSAADEYSGDNVDYPYQGDTSYLTPQNTFGQTSTTAADSYQPWSPTSDGGLILQGVSDTLGTDWTNNLFSSGAIADSNINPVLNTFGQRVPDSVSGTDGLSNLATGASKEDSGGVFSSINKLLSAIGDDKNKNVTNLAANFIAGMMAAPYRKMAAEAQMKQAEASMINANSNATTNAGTLAIKQKQLENGSSIKNTNFGSATTPGTGLIYKNLLAERQDRNGAPT